MKAKLVSLAMVVFTLINCILLPASAESNIIQPDSESVPKDIIEMIEENDHLKVSDVNSEDLNSVTFDNADGSKTLYMYSTPIKVKDENGKAEFKNNEGEKSKKKLTRNSIATNDTYAIENSSNDIKTYLPTKINDGLLIEKEKYSLQMIPMSENNSKIKINKNADEEYYEYKNVFGKDTSLEYYYTLSGFKENIVLDKPVGQNEFRFKIISNNLIPKQYKGSTITFIDPETNEEKYTISQLDAKDVKYNIDFEAKHFTIDNYYTLEKISENEYLLTAIIDKEFLESETTAYPVVIDPTVRWNYLTKDTSVYENNDAYFAVDTYNMIGDCSKVTYGYLGEGLILVKGDISQYTYINPDYITRARYYAVEGSGTSSSINVGVYAPQNDWEQATVTYSDIRTRVSYVSPAVTVTTSGGYYFDVTSKMKEWIRYEIGQSSTTNKGIALIPTSYSANQSKSFYSQESGISTKPAFVVDYDTPQEISNGYYYIRNKATKLYMDVYMAYTSSGTDVTQCDFNAHGNQKWYVQRQSNGTYTIRPQHASNMYLSLADTTSNTDGNNILQSSETMTWNIVRNYDKSFRIMPSISNSKCAEIYGGYSYSGATIKMWDYWGGAHQDWLFDPVEKKAANLIGTFDEDGADRTSWIISISPCTSNMGYSTYNGSGCNATYALAFLQMGSICTIHTHGSPSSLKFTELNGNVTWLYISAINSIPNDHDLGSERLVIYAGCQTGQGGSSAYNLVNSTFDKGAKTVIGFQDIIYNNSTNEWLQTFFRVSDQNKTIETAANDALSYLKTWHDGYTGGLESIYLRGSKVQKLKE